MMPSAAPTCHRGREIAQASKNSVNSVIICTLPHCCVYSHSIELILVVIQSVATVIVCSILSIRNDFLAKIMQKNKNKKFGHTDYFYSIILVTLIFQKM